jgi:hypothetical protein
MLKKIAIAKKRKDVKDCRTSFSLAKSGMVGIRKNKRRTADGFKFF